MRKNLLRHRNTLIPWALLFGLFILALPIALDASIFGLDSKLASYLSSARSPFLTTLFSYITILASSAFVTGCTAACVLFCIYLIPRGFAYAVGIMVATGGAALTELMLKDIIGRVRPDMPLFWEPTLSFPSGHATIAAALYGFLIFLAWHRLHTKTARFIALAAGLTLIAAIGFSRVYLGLHYPSDVVGGYLLGAFWVLIGIHASGAIRTTHERRSRS